MLSEELKTLLERFDQGPENAWDSLPVRLMKLLLATLVLEAPLLMFLGLAVAWDSDVLAGLVIIVMLAVPHLMHIFGINAWVMQLGARVSHNQKEELE